MSEEAGKELSRKEKRALRDAERFKGGKKRKRTETADEDAQDAGKEDEVTDQSAAPPATEPTSDGATANSSRKRKRGGEEEKSQPSQKEGVLSTETAPVKPSKKPKNAKALAEDGTEKPTNSRFIVFLGNLPYNTTDTSLQAHFVKLQPFTLRHRTDPKTKKSKGFAFLEFENYDRMKTCLKLYHHSYFDPETAGKGEVEFATGEEEETRGFRKDKRKGRRINVELTAGGGGGKDTRMEKIKVKNVRLEEQRKRRLEAEKKEKIRKERRGGKVQKTDANPDHGSDETAGAADAGGSGMHPSRLARLGG